MKILADKNIPYVGELFSEFGTTYVVDGRNICFDLLKFIDILIIRSITKINKELIDCTPVKFIGTTTSGMDHLDINWLLKSGIKFVNAPGCNAIAVVEYVLYTLFWLANHQKFFLCDKIIGIIGVGNIGRLLSTRCRDFGINTILCDPPLADLGISGDWRSFESLVAEADILTFHVPLTFNGVYATWHKINEDVLSALPSNRILINTSRGSIIDSQALYRVLQGGKKLNIIFDVWENEPLIPIYLLNYIDFGTPHIAGVSHEGKIRGVVQVFNLYLDSIGYNKKIDASSFISDKKQQIRLRRRLNQQILFNLMNYIYRIYIDRSILNNIANKPNLFDKLRVFYSSRREWSSLEIQVSNSVDCEILMQLGFNVI